MAHETLQLIVGTAIVDSEFRQSLLKESSDVVKSFELTSEESEAIRGIQAESLEGFASELHRWISRGSGRRLRGVSY